MKSSFFLHMIMGLFLCGMLALPMVAAGQSTSGSQSSQAGPKQSAATKPDASQAGEQDQNDNQKLSSSDKLFLKALIQEDMSEIQLARVALQKSSNDQVKQYAQSKILGADPQMRDGAEKIARQHGITPPTDVNGRQKEMHKKLTAKSGKLFDNAYMNYEADKQTADVVLVKRELKTTNSSDIKSYLDKEKTPVVEAAKSAKKISTDISSSMTNYRQPAGTGQSER